MLDLAARCATAAQDDHHVGPLHLQRVPEAGCERDALRGEGDGAGDRAVLVSRGVGLDRERGQSGLAQRGDEHVRLVRFEPRHESRWVRGEPHAGFSQREARRVGHGSRGLVRARRRAHDRDELHLFSLPTAIGCGDAGSATWNVVPPWRPGSTHTVPP